MPDSTTIAYIVQIFPYRTETFISREVIALRKAGFNVITLANHAPKKDSINSDDWHLRENTAYVFPIGLQRVFMIIFAHLMWIITHFSAYIAALRHLLSEESQNPRVWLRNIMHFVGGVYLAWTIRNKGIEHLHAHYAINAASMALFMSILLEIPFSMTIHNIFFTDNLLMESKLDRAKFIACISGYSRDYLLNKYPEIKILGEKMQIIHCGIPLEKFPFLKSGINPHNPLQIFCACQLVERKGVRFLIEACNKLKQDNISFRCIIAGNGKELSTLKSLVLSFGLNEHIDFVGTYTQEDLLHYFEESVMFVLPCVVAQNGDRDGIPVVLMEAMAVGVPVISTHVSGIPELIESGENGLLVEQKDSEALAEAIKTLLYNPELRHILSQSAYTKVYAEYNMEITIQQLIQQFNKGYLADET